MLADRNIKAIEIFASSKCQLDCKYCYIPKSDVMNSIHKRIVKLIHDFDVSSISPDVRHGIEILGFWGAEPTLTLGILSQNLKKIVDAFPNLRKIDFSTNGIDIRPIEDFILNCNKYGINVSFQFSIDGPEYINGMNRMPNLLDRVINNMKQLITDLNAQDLKIFVDIRTKGTLTKENIKYLLENNLVNDFVAFFKTLGSDLERMVENKKVRVFTPLSFNLEVPGTYTAEDGKQFSIFLRKLHEAHFDSAFTSRLRRILDFRYSLNTKPCMFTCSGGDSNLGFDFNRIHICHRTFLLDNDDYLMDILKHKPDNWDVKNLARGTAEQVKRYFIITPDNFERFVYLMRSYHDFWRLRLGNTISEIKELAAAGLIKRYYLYNDDLAELFAIFLNVANSCPVENLLVNGSLFVVPASIIKLWGNGAFYELLKRTIRRR